MKEFIKMVRIVHDGMLDRFYKTVMQMVDANIFQTMHRNVVMGDFAI